MNIYYNHGKGECVMVNGRKHYLYDYSECDYTFDHKGRLLTATHVKLNNNDGMWLMIRTGDTCKVYYKEF